MNYVNLFKVVLLFTAFMPAAVMATEKVKERPVVAIQDYFPQVREIHIGKKIFKNEKGESVEGEQGYIVVPEVRSNPESRPIKVAFVRIKTTAENPVPPVVLLHGGPTSKGIIQTRSSRIHVLTEMQDFADQILIDGRGLGLSEPALVCDNEHPEFIINFDAMYEMYKRQGSKCKAYWEEKGADLRGYHPVEYADDVADLMVSLGYEKFSLTGNSYGAYWSMAVAKRHPEKVHRMAISGVFGLDRSWGLPSEGEQAFASLAKQVDAVETSRSLLGDEGTIAALNTIMERLEKSPVTVEVDFFDRKETVTLDPETISRIIYSSGMTQHRQGASSLPLFLYALEKGAYEGIVRLIAAGVEREFKPLPSPFNISAISVLCNLPRSNSFLHALDEELKQPASNHWVGQHVEGRHNAFACDDVAYPFIDPDWVAPFTSDIPVFAMSGSFDGNTTPAGAKHSLASFPNTHWVIVNGGAHRHREIEQAVPEVAKLKREFLAGKDFDAGTVTIDAPPLKINTIPWYGRALFSIGLGNTILEYMAPGK